MGALTVALFGSLVGTAFAASTGKLTNIKVISGGIKLFVDGKLIKPTDGNGKVVEPFIYDGTTYLPLRALSNALTNYEKPVNWDSATSSIYVGQAPVAAQTDLADLKTYNNNDVNVRTGEEAAFQLLDKTITPFNRLDSYSSFTYMLHSNYSQINGQFVIPYTSLGDDSTGKVYFYSVDKKGNQTLIQEYSAEAGDDPVSLTVDLRGVEILVIQTMYSGAFYNATLTGIN
ncbi:hypothetical protein GOM71_15815 [Paenibacillus sp. NEAU-GSW1]|nr:hypothetical protein [Paenibacillus sp. NEAU-GSW1]